MDFFETQEGNEGLKREVAFQTIVSVRDTINFAQRSNRAPTYEQALRLIHDLDPDLYQDFVKILREKNENDTVKLYKEQAKIKSTTTRQLKAEDLINERIKEYELLKQSGKEKNETVRFINSELIKLYAALENLKPRRINENGILVQDFSQVNRTDIFGEQVFKSSRFIDYELRGDRFLRLRLLHPDAGEQLTGADLVYEQYNMTTEKVRFVFLQYKTWHNGTLYFSQHKNLQPQLEKLRSLLCDCNYCTDDPDNEEIEFRMPHCSAFLRPTDVLQHENSKMVSSGYHIPVCNAFKYLDNSKKLEKKIIKHSSPNHYIFEKLFNQNLVGSRWLSIKEIEQLYQDKEILQPSETLKLYAREILTSNKEVEDDDEVVF
jgi:hypothetical protein